MSHAGRRLARLGFAFVLLATLLLPTTPPRAAVQAAPPPPEAPQEVPTTGPFRAGNLVVVRVGDGSGSLSDDSAPVFLDEFSVFPVTAPSDPPNTVPIRSIPLPANNTGGAANLTLSGLTGIEGMITRSPTGKYVVLAGYDALADTDRISFTESLLVNRVVARVPASGTFDISTRINTGFNQRAIRGAAINGENDIWVTGSGVNNSGGLYYIQRGTTGGQRLSTTNNVRVPGIFNGQLYVSMTSEENYGVVQVGNGLPTSGTQTFTLLPGFPRTAGPGPSTFVAFDLSSPGGIDTIYAADERELTLGGGIQKWILNGSSWVLAYTLSGDLTAGVRGLTGIDGKDEDGNGVPVLYGTTAETPSKLIRMIDSGPGARATILAESPGGGTVFRGVAFTPGSNSPDLTVGLVGPSGTQVFGRPYKYTLTVTNNGLETAQVATGTGDTDDVVVRFTLPSSVTFVNIPTTPGAGFEGSYDEDTHTVTFARGRLAGGSRTALEVQVRPNNVSQVVVPSGAVVVDPNDRIAEVDDANNSSTQVITTPIDQPPTVSVASSSTRLINPPDISGVIGDTRDPAGRVGITLTISDTRTAVAALTMAAFSSDPAVVPNNATGLNVSGTGANRLLRIVPQGVGYAQITVVVTDAVGLGTPLTFDYAASAASATPSTTRFYTGASDGSTGVSSGNYLLVASERDQVIRLYTSADSGLPIRIFPISDTQLGLDPDDPSVDIEAAARNSSQVLWVTSHNSGSHNRLFATAITGITQTTALTFTGYYDELRDDLINWDRNNDHGQGVGRYFVDILDIDMEIEGADFSPDGEELFLGFRTLVPGAAPRKALIVPVTNPGDLVSGTPAAGPAEFGAPIELDLGGLAISELRKVTPSQYLILAGPPNRASPPILPGEFRMYTWTGDPDDDPQEYDTNLGAINSPSSLEGLVVNSTVPLTRTSRLTVLSDNTEVDWYDEDAQSATLDPPYQKFRADVVALGAANTRISTIQGRTHISPMVPVVSDNAISFGAPITDVIGIVTAITPNGFYMQDPEPDLDPATSEGIFVVAPGGDDVLNVRASVVVTGTVAEVRPDCTTAACTSSSPAWNNLTITQLRSTPTRPLTYTVLSSDQPLPAAVTIGTAGQQVPTTTMYLPAMTNIETSTLLRPDRNGLDFYESIEGMWVQLSDAVVVGPSNNGQLVVLPSEGSGASLRTPRQGIVVGENYADFNPERIIIDDELTAVPNTAAVGDRIGSVVGVMSYRTGNYLLYNTMPLTLTAAGQLPETTDRVGEPDKLTIATFDLANVAPSNADQLSRIADVVVDRLRAPDLLAVQDVLDNDGTTDNGTVTAAQTFGALIQAISAAGGPVYGYRQIDPVNNQDGGSGNPRVGFLFRTDRGLAFVDRPGGSAVLATGVISAGGQLRLTYSPGRISPSNAAFNGNRKVLVGEFTYNDRTLFVVNANLTNKTPDQALGGRRQPPLRSSDTQRQQQAALVGDFVEDVLALDSQALVVVLGDMNDFAFSTALTTLETAGLENLTEALDPAERYTTIVDGNSEALDHILVSEELVGTHEYDIVHTNSEYPAAARAGDRDPAVVRLPLGDLSDTEPPTTTILDGPDDPSQSTSATFIFTGTDNVAPPPPLRFECSLDGAAFELCSSPKTYTGLTNGPHTFQVRTRDAANNLDEPEAWTWQVQANDTVAPTTTITGQPANPSLVATAIFTFTGSDDRTPVASLRFECQLDTAAFAACTSPRRYNGLSNGPHTFRVRARDAADNIDATPASYSWTVSVPDTTAPTTTITAQPPNPSNSTGATFRFTGSDDRTPAAGLVFECSLDGSAFVACTSPRSYSSLTEGSHTFRVRARDAANNVDATPASYTWIIRTRSSIYLPFLRK